MIRNLQPRTSDSTRSEWLVPTATAVGMLLLGAAVNSFYARDLEQQKFRFEVLKFAMEGTTQSERLKRLCEFSDRQLIDDPDRRYHRTEIDGVRPCAVDNDPTTPFVATSARRSRLLASLGSTSRSDGHLSFEDGFLKVDGYLGDVRDLDDVAVSPTPPDRIVVKAVQADGPDWTDQTLVRANDARDSQILVTRSGRLIQPRNLYERREGNVVTVALTTQGVVERKDADPDRPPILIDGSGRLVAEGDIVRFSMGLRPELRQRFTDAQVEQARRVVLTLCETFPGRPVVVGRYLAGTLALQRKAISEFACPAPSPQN